jgi:hypothetical protein
MPSFADRANRASENDKADRMLTTAPPLGPKAIIVDCEQIDRTEPHPLHRMRGTLR